MPSERSSMSDDPGLPDAKVRLAQLIEAIAKHRTERYGAPPRGPFYAADIELYKRAGMA